MAAHRYVVGQECIFTDMGESQAFVSRNEERVRIVRLKRSEECGSNPGYQVVSLKDGNGWGVSEDELLPA